MLRLKEQPGEWIKFTLVMGVVLNVVVWWLWWQGKLPRAAGWAAAGIAGAAVLAALIRPRWFRGFYRGGMTVSFHVGQVVGKVLLTVIFFAVVTPTGLILRLTGRDLLQLKMDREKSTWWRKAKDNREFDRMF